jgi:hypothetical protein
MGNMSYCRFENTYKDLYECYNNMENVNSESEKRYRQHLIQLCQNIVDEYSDLEDEEDDDE